MKEGISEEQWAALERQNHKKNQEKHKFERWFDIWRILFPGVDEPRTPCKFTGRERSENVANIGAPRRKAC